VGYILKQPEDLAKTFRAYRENGPDVFYRGEISQAIVVSQKRYRTTAPPAVSGEWTLDDLDQYNVKSVSPSSTSIAAATVSHVSAVLRRLTVIQMLKMLERFALAMEQLGLASYDKDLHVMIEAWNWPSPTGPCGWAMRFRRCAKVGLIADPYMVR